MRLVLAALLLLLAATPARGQDGGVTVARHGDAQLLVRDADEAEGGMCLDLRIGTRSSAGTCGHPAGPSRRALFLTAQTGSRSYTAGAVPAAGTVEVELEFARGERVRARTVAGEAYTGRHAGEYAFFLADTTGAQRPPTDGGEEDEPLLIRRFDADGKLVGASAGGYSEHVVAGPQVLMRARGLRVTAAARRAFAPSVLQLDRTETAVCLRVERRDGDTGGGPCSTPGPVQPVLAVLPQRECGHGTLVHGFVAPQVKAVELLLGDGRRARTRMYDVSALGTTARAVAAVVPPGVAVRSARALDAAGGRLESHVLESPPATRRCPKGAGSLVAFGYGSTLTSGIGGEGQLVAGAAAGPRLVARDEGDQLCVGIDGFGEDDHECVVPAPDAEFAQTIERSTPRYTAIGGLVPDAARSVRVEFDGRTWVTAAISDGGAYDGRYRGRVRFYLAQSGPGRKVTSVRTYDAAGALLSAIPGESAPGTAERTVARGPGYRIIGRRYDFLFKIPGLKADRERGTCFAIAHAGRRPDPHECLPLVHGLAAGAVWCAPRRGVLVGGMTKGLRGARFELAGGGSIRSRTVTVPRRLGGGRLWVLEIPPRARVRRLRYLGRLAEERFGPGRARVRDYPLPAPSRQCGYGLDVTF